MGALLALAYGLLGFAAPGALVPALLLGTVVDLPFHVGPLVVYSNELALAGGLLGLALRPWRGRPLPALPLHVALAALVLPSVALLHAFGPGPAGAAVKDALRLAQFSLAVLLPAWLCQGPRGRAAFRVAGAWLGLAVLAAAAQVAAGPGKPINAGHEIEVLGGTWQLASSFFQHHNQAAAAFVAGLALSSAVAWDRRSPAWSLLALGCLAALGLTGSRGAWVGLAAGGAVLLPRLGRRMAFAGLAALLVILLVAVASGGAALRGRLSSLERPPADRILIWGQGRAILGGAWLWGRGPGAVQRELPGRIRALGLPDRDASQYASHLHSQWLQAAVETGLAGLLAWAVFLWILARTAWRAPSPWGPMLLLGLTAFAVQAGTDLLTLHARGMAPALLWGLLLAGAGALRPPEFEAFGQRYFAGGLRAAAQRVLEGRGSRTVCVANVHTAMQGLWDPALRGATAGADLRVPDGRPLSLLARAQGIDAGPVRGADLMLAVARQGLPKGTRHFFYGGKPGVARAAARRLQALVPGLKVAGTASPGPAEVAAGKPGALARRLRAGRVQVLWVGLGAPKQELWMARMRGQLPVAMLGVGAAFDFYAGSQPQAPRWMQALALEWLHRLAHEPKRLWRRYLPTNAAFLALAPLEILGLWPRRSR